MEPLADVFRGATTSIKRFLTVLFRSQFFYGETCRRTRSSSPVECVDRRRAARWASRLAAPDVPRPASTAMGQELFAPPNVKGWDGERKWINAGTLLARAAGVRPARRRVASGNDSGPNLDDLRRWLPPRSHRPEEGRPSCSSTCVLEGGWSKKSRAEVAEFLVTRRPGPRPERLRRTRRRAVRRSKVRETVGVAAQPARSITRLIEPNVSERSANLPLRLDR